MLDVASLAVDTDKILPAEEGTYEVTYEVVFAHAFAPQIKEHPMSSDGVVSVPVSELRKSLLKG